VGAEEAENNRGSEKHEALKWARAEETGETENGGGENEQQSDAEEPGGENADDEAPTSPGQ